MEAGGFTLNVFIRLVYLINKPPKGTPLCQEYQKSMEFLVSTTFQCELDLDWWMEMLTLSKEYFSATERC